MILALTRTVIVPPYCGIPKESHQWPRVLVVDVVEDTAVAVVFGAVEVTIVVGVVY